MIGETRSGGEMPKQISMFSLRDLRVRRNRNSPSLEIIEITVRNPRLFDIWNSNFEYDLIPFFYPRSIESRPRPLLTSITETLDHSRFTLAQFIFVSTVKDYLLRHS